jgi:hypothetical protein
LTPWRSSEIAAHYVFDPYALIDPYFIQEIFETTYQSLATNFLKPG